MATFSTMFLDDNLFINEMMHEINNLEFNVLVSLVLAT